MLGAALGVFADKGFEGATVEEIAARAEFGKGTLYNYFPAGKEEILSALVDELYDGLNGVIGEHLAAASLERLPARDVFRGLVEQLISHFAANRATFLLLMKEAHRLMINSGEARDSRLMAHRERTIAAIEPALGEAMARGELRPYPPRAVAHMLMGNVQGYLMYAFTASGCGHAEHEVWPPVDEAASFIADILFEGLLVRHDS